MSESAHKIAGVIGWPVAHSLSPCIHRHWLNKYGIAGDYIPLPVERTDFARVVMALQRCGFAGVNVTIPHKEAAFAMAHTVDRIAVITGAANTLVFGEDGWITAHNTDVAGLARSFTQSLGDGFLREKKVLLLGAGGAARAAVLALAELGAKQIVIANRDEARARNLIAYMTPHVSPSLEVASLERCGDALPDSGLLINATSAGMSGTASLDIAVERLPKESAVCDIVYRPLETPLLQRARGAGLKTVDGLGMLLHQAAPAFGFFFGQQPSVTQELRESIEGALHG